MSAGGFYVVVVYNQASGWPSELLYGNIYADPADAARDADEAREGNRAVGRRERYVVARLENVEPPS